VIVRPGRSDFGVQSFFKRLLMSLIALLLVCQLTFAKEERKDKAWFRYEAKSGG
jgi:hypothetical protein